MPSVGETPVPLGVDAYLIKNLGPDDVYVGNSDVTTSNGFPLTMGDSLAVGYGNESTFAVSDGTSDVRILPRGSSVVYAPAAAEPAA